MTRKKMPARYDVVRQRVKLGGRTIYVDIGRDAEGVIRSLFVDAYKTGTEPRALMEVISRAVSLLLQYDVPLATVAKLLRGTKFSPAGSVDKDPKVHFASSPLDYVAKHLTEEA